MQDDVDQTVILDFINNFKDAQSTFLNGCCWWFAHILSVRFGGSTYHEPIENHFVQKIGNHFYDVRGDVTAQYANRHMDCFDTYENVDPCHYQRLVRDCVMKERNDD